MIKSRIFLDFLSVLMVVLIIAMIFYQKIMWLTVVVVALYSISIIVLGIRKSEKFSHGLAIFIGAIIIPVVLPLIYYFTYLRKKIGKPVNHVKPQ